jgi:hypothetical protein
MAKTTFDKVIEKLQNGKCDVDMAQMKDPEKPKKGDACCCEPDPDWSKPNIYVSDELPELWKETKIGDKLYIVCECRVASISSDSFTENGKKKETHSVRLVIDNFAQLS